MRAIILAAGRGSRMGALTEARPKCLTELGGRTLLAWQLAALRGAGIEGIALVTGYRAEALPTEGLATFHNPAWAETNMVASLACAAEWLRAGPCIVSYADIVYSADAVTRLCGSGADIAIAYDPAWLGLWSARFDDPLADAETFQVDGAGRLTEIGGRARSVAEIQGQYMGLLRFTPAGWRRVESDLSSLLTERVHALDMTSLLRALIAAGAVIPTVPIGDRWYEVDSACDLALYEDWLAATDPFAASATRKTG